MFRLKDLGENEARLQVLDAEHPVSEEEAGVADLKDVWVVLEGVIVVILAGFTQCERDRGNYTQNVVDREEKRN